MAFPEELYCKEEDTYQIAVSLGPSTQNYNPKGFPEQAFLYARTWAIEQIKTIISPRFKLDQIETYTEIINPPPDPPTFVPNPVPPNIKYLCAILTAKFILEPRLGQNNINQQLFDKLSLAETRYRSMILRGFLYDFAGEIIYSSNGIQLNNGFKNSLPRIYRNDRIRINYLT